MKIGDRDQMDRMKMVRQVKQLALLGLMLGFIGVTLGMVAMFVPDSQTPDPGKFKAQIRETMAQIRLEDNIAEMKALENRYERAPEQTADGKKIYGNPNSRYRIQEISDIECPYCKMFYAIPKAVIDDLGDEVSLEWINLPLPFHDPKASEEAKVVQCVYDLGGNRKFFLALHELFEHTKSNGQGGDLKYTELAESLGIKPLDFEGCMNDPKLYDRAIGQDKKFVISHGIQSTPSALLIDTETGNTHKLEGGMPKEEFLKLFNDFKAGFPEKVKNDEQKPAGE